MIIIITFIVGIIEWHIIYDSWFIVTCGIVKPFDTSIIWLSSTNTVAWHVLNWRKKNKKKWDQICINNSTSIKLYTACLLPGPLSPSLSPPFPIYGPSEYTIDRRRKVRLIRIVWNIKWFEKFNYKLTINAQLPWPNQFFCTTCLRIFNN